MKYAAAVAFCAAALTTGVFAAKVTSISGEIHGGSALWHLRVELAATGGTATSHRTLASPNGTFGFADVAYGVYELRVISAGGDLLKRELVFAGDGLNHFSVELPERRSPSRGGGTVSIRQLRHKVPKPALKLAKKSDALRRKRDYRGSAELLEQAVALDPEFLPAFNNLGCRYMEMGEYAKAADAYSKAVAIDPSQAFVYVNLSVALINAERAADAVAAARRAMDLDPGSPKARYALGMALYHRLIVTPETLQLLHESAPAFPLARLALAQVYSRLGWNRLARENLAQYAEKSPPERGAQVQEWMNALKAQR